MKKLVLLLCALTVMIIPAQQPMKVTLAWNQNPESNLAGYKIYYRQGTNAEIIVNVPFNPAIPLSTGTVTQDIFLGSANANYVFAVTAHNTAGLESERSAQVSYDTPVVQPNRVGDPDAVVVPR
jgi:hypothetical protein